MGFAIDAAVILFYFAAIVFIGLYMGRREKTLVTLRSEGPVTLIVEAWRDVDHADMDSYYYNEHTCPTNYLRDVLVVIQELDERVPVGRVLEEHVGPAQHEHGRAEARAGPPARTSAPRR